jgi:hypothetical protein
MIRGTKRDSSFQIVITSVVFYNGKRRITEGDPIEIIDVTGVFS